MISRSTSCCIILPFSVQKPESEFDPPFCPERDSTRVTNPHDFLHRSEFNAALLREFGHAEAIHGVELQLA